MRHAPAARRRFRHVLRVEPASSAALRNLTLVESDAARALRISYAALLLMPDDGRIALAHAQRHDPKGGKLRALASRACRLAPDNADAWALRGAEALLRYAHAEAMAALRIAVLLQPPRADLHYRRGRVCVFAMDVEQAWWAFGRTLRITPGDNDARGWRDRAAGWVRKRRRRAATAARWLAGHGIEVGAQHEPLQVPAAAHVRYIDYLSADEQRRRNPDIDCFAFVEPDQIDDGERLETVADGSLDFIIANHFLEHCEDPLGTLARHAAKLRPGGILFYAVPHAHNIYDRNRPITTLEHVLADSRDGGIGSRLPHYREVARVTHGLAGEEAEQRALALMHTRQTIHFHVWNVAALRAVIDVAVANSDPRLIVREFVNADEMIVVLQSGEPSSQAVSSRPG
jgi:SAM-dependent methyltransferase